MGREVDGQDVCWFGSWGSVDYRGLVSRFRFGSGCFGSFGDWVGSGYDALFCDPLEFLLSPLVGLDFREELFEDLFWDGFVAFKVRGPEGWSRRLEVFASGL